MASYLALQHISRYSVMTENTSTDITRIFRAFVAVILVLLLSAVFIYFINKVEFFVEEPLTEPELALEKAFNVCGSKREGDTHVVVYYEGDEWQCTSFVDGRDK